MTEESQSFLTVKLPFLLVLSMDQEIVLKAVDKPEIFLRKGDRFYKYPIKDRILTKVLQGEIEEVYCHLPKDTQEDSEDEAQPVPGYPSPSFIFHV